MFSIVHETRRYLSPSVPMEEGQQGSPKFSIVLGTGSDSEGKERGII